MSDTKERSLDAEHRVPVDALMITLGALTTARYRAHGYDEFDVMWEARGPASGIPYAVFYAHLRVGDFSWYSPSASVEWARLRAERTADERVSA